MVYNMLSWYIYILHLIVTIVLVYTSITLYNSHLEDSTKYRNGELAALYLRAKIGELFWLLCRGMVLGLPHCTVISVFSVYSHSPFSSAMNNVYSSFLKKMFSTQGIFLTFIDSIGLETDFNWYVFNISSLVLFSLFLIFPGYSYSPNFIVCTRTQLDIYHLSIINSWLSSINK